MTKKSVVNFWVRTVGNTKFLVISSAGVEKKYSPTWHCIVGRKFGSYVSHETKQFTLFLMLGGNILLFKAG